MLLPDNVITPDAFAQTLLDDFHLPPNFRTKIVAAINDQIAEYQNLLSVSTRSSLGSSVVDAPRGVLSEKDAAWWRRERAMLNKLAEASPSKLAVKAARAVANCKGRAAVEDSEEEDDAVGVLELKDDGEEKADDERPMTVAELGTQLGEYGFEEMRVVIKVRQDRSCILRPVFHPDYSFTLAARCFRRSDQPCRQLRVGRRWASYGAGTVRRGLCR